MSNAGAEKLVVFRKRTASSRIVCLEAFPQAYHTEAVGQRRPRPYLVMAAEHGDVQESPGKWLVLKIRSGQGKQLRWHCGKPREATGDVASSVVAEAPGSTGSGRETEAWHHVARSEPLNKDQEKSLVKPLSHQCSMQYQMQWEPQHSGDPSAMEQPPKTAEAVEWSWPEPVSCSVCVL